MRALPALAQCCATEHPWVAPEKLAALAETPIELVNKAREGTFFLHEVSDLNARNSRALLQVGKLDNTTRA